MKIRINGPSIRLRLSQTEVDKICTDGIVKTACPIGEEIFIYSLQVDDTERMHAAMQHGSITVFVPKNLIKDWSKDQRVGFDITTDDGLYLLIEKDFQCLKPREHEDESDLFTNPLAGEGC